MKIGEALLEIEHLNRRLDALESRLLHDKEVGRPLGHLLQQIEGTAHRLRDLQIAVNWTHQHIAISQVPLGSYVSKSEQLERTARLLENVDSPDLREKVDALQEAKNQTNRVVQAVYWAYDLLIPDVKVEPKPKEEN